MALDDRITFADGPETPEDQPTGLDSVVRFEGDAAPSPMGEAKPVEQGMLSKISDWYNQGYTAARRNIAQQKGLMFDETPEDVARTGARVKELEREEERYSLDPTGDTVKQLREISEADSIMEAVGLMLKYPEATASVTVSSLGRFAPALAATTGVGAMTGGATVPLMASTFMGSLSVEYGAVMDEVIRESGYDSSDPRAWGKASRDKAMLERGREKALKRGIPIAAFDAISMGLAGKLLASAKPTAASIMTMSAGEVGMQVGLGGAGEAAGQYVDTGKIESPGEVALEGFAEMGPGIVETLIGYKGEKQKALRRQMAEQAGAEAAQREADLKLTPDFETKSLEENETAIDEAIAAAPPTPEIRPDEESITDKFDLELNAEALEEQARAEDAAKTPQDIANDEFVAQQLREQFPEISEEEIQELVGWARPKDVKPDEGMQPVAPMEELPEAPAETQAWAEQKADDLGWAAPEEAPAVDIPVRAKPAQPQPDDEESHPVQSRTDKKGRVTNVTADVTESELEGVPITTTTYTATRESDGRKLSTGGLNLTIDEFKDQFDIDETYLELLEEGGAERVIIREEKTGGGRFKAVIDATVLFEEGVQEFSAMAASRREQAERGGMLTEPAEPEPDVDLDLDLNEEALDQAQLDEKASEPVEDTGWASATANEVSTKRPELENLILSFKPGDDRNGKTVPHYYGEIDGTIDNDGMAKDVILNKDYNADQETPIFIVNQNDWETGEFRQHKIMAGFEDSDAAEQGYIDQFDAEGFGGINEISREEFEAWKKGDGKTPFTPSSVEPKAGDIANVTPKDFDAMMEEAAPSSAEQTQNVDDGRARPPPEIDKIISNLRDKFELQQAPFQGLVNAIDGPQATPDERKFLDWYRGSGWTYSGILGYDVPPVKADETEVARRERKTDILGHGVETEPTTGKPTENDLKGVEQKSEVDKETRDLFMAEDLNFEKPTSTMINYAIQFGMAKNYMEAREFYRLVDELGIDLKTSGHPGTVKQLRERLEKQKRRDETDAGMSEAELTQSSAEQTQRMSIEDLDAIADPNVPIAKMEEHESAYLDNLQSQIERDGITRPIDVTTKNGKPFIIMDGNHRLAVMHRLGLKDAPVRFLSEDQSEVEALAQDEYLAAGLTEDEAIDAAVGATRADLETIAGMSEAEYREQTGESPEESDILDAEMWAAQDRADRSEAQRIRATKQVEKNRQVHETDDLITFLRKLGGINVDNQSDITPEMMEGLDDKKIIGVAGLVQHGDKGMHVDDAALEALQAGYINEHDISELADLIDDARHGPVYNHAGMQAHMEREAEEAYNELLAAEADEWAEYVNQSETSQVDPETVRLMALAGAHDHDTMVDIVSMDAPESEVQAALQAFIDERESRKTETASAAEPAEEAGRPDETEPEAAETPSDDRGKRVKRKKKKAAKPLEEMSKEELEEELGYGSTLQDADYLRELLERKRAEGAPAAQTEEQTDFVGKTAEEEAQQAIEDEKRRLEEQTPTERPAEAQSGDDLFASGGQLEPDLFAAPETKPNPKKVALIACCSEKSPGKSSARDLYRSPLFRASMKYAESLGADEIHVLSAEHGLVGLDDQLDPYDTTLKDKTKDQREAWARKVYNQITGTYDINGTEFVVLAGKDYRAELSSLLEQHPNTNITVPLEGLGIGEQMKRLKELVQPNEEEAETFNSLAKDRKGYPAQDLTEAEKRELYPDIAFEVGDEVRLTGEGWGSEYKNASVWLGEVGTVREILTPESHPNLIDPTPKAKKARADIGDTPYHYAVEFPHSTKSIGASFPYSPVWYNDMIELVDDAEIDEASMTPAAHLEMIEDWIFNEGMDHATLIPSVGQAPDIDSTTSMRQYEDALRDAGWETFTIGKGEFWRKDGAELFLSSQGGLSPPIVQFKAKMDMDSVLAQSREPLVDSIPLAELDITVDTGEEKVTLKADKWLDMIDERLEMANKLRGCV